MFDGIVPLLALFTLLSVAMFAIISKERTKERMRDPNAPTSTLARDGKYGGVAFLVPLAERQRRNALLTVDEVASERGYLRYDDNRPVSVLAE